MKTKTGEVRLTEPGRRETKEHAEAALSGFIRVARYQRNEFLRYALAGDWAPLAKYIRDGGRVRRCSGQEETAPACENKQVGNEAKKW